MSAWEFTVTIQLREPSEQLLKAISGTTEMFAKALSALPDAQVDWSVEKDRDGVERKAELTGEE